MRPMIIAVSNRGFFRLVDLDTISTKTSNAKVLDITMNNMVSAMSKGMNIVNAVLNNGSIIGTQGNLYNYPSVENGGPCVILSSIDNHTGYQLINEKGKVVKASRSQVVAFAEKFGVANGKVALSNGEKYIEPLMGSFNEMHLTASRVGNNRGVDVSIKMQGHKDSLNSHANASVSVEIKDADVFKCMTPTQKEVLKQYYVWYTTRLYREMAKSMRLDVSASKVERLGYMRGEYTWECNGIIDAYLEGRYNAKCSLGHILRYEYHAKCEDTGHEIIFGETCAGDFFKIEKEDMKRLVKARKVMSDELTLISDAITNGQQEELKSCVSLFYEIIYKIGTPQKLVDIFGEHVGKTIANFVNNNIPIVESLVKLANERIQKIGVREFMSKLYGDDIYTTVVNSLSENGSMQSIMIKYLDFMFTNRIEGYYSYDPYNVGHKRRDIGAYNKDTRYERKNLIRYFRNYLGLKDFRFEHSINIEDKENYPDGKIIYDDRLSSIEKVLKVNKLKILYTDAIEKTISKCIDRYKTELCERVPYGYDECSFVNSNIGDVCGNVVYKLMTEKGRKYGYYYGSRVTNEMIEETLEKGPKEPCDLICAFYEEKINKEKEIKAEREREERERLKKQEEEERIRREAESKAIEEALAKASVKKNDKLEEVYQKVLKLDKGNSLLDDYSVKIVMDMGKRGLDYESCSENQKHMINIARSKVLGEVHDETIKEFKSLKSDIERTLGSNDAGFKICCSIEEKANTDDEMSVKQMWRMKDTIARYKQKI